MVETDQNNGVANFEAFRQQYRHALPAPTLKIKTLEGGYYFIYGKPDLEYGVEWVFSQKDIAKLQGVNFRGDNNYIVVPPSLDFIEPSPQLGYNELAFYKLEGRTHLNRLPAIVLDLIDNGAFPVEDDSPAQNPYDFLFNEACRYLSNGMTEAELLDVISTQNEFMPYSPVEWDSVKGMVKKALSSGIRFQESNTHNLTNNVGNAPTEHQ